MNSLGQTVIAGGKRFSSDATGRVLFIKDVNLDSIREIKGLDDVAPLVHALYVIDSRLRKLDGIEILTNLERAWFNNHLESLEGIQACPNITFLEAKDNNITSMEPIDPLMKLQFLYLQNNKISHPVYIKGSNYTMTITVVAITSRQGLMGITAGLVVVLSAGFVIAVKVRKKGVKREWVDA